MLPMHVSGGVPGGAAPPWLHLLNPAGRRLHLHAWTVSFGPVLVVGRRGRQQLAQCDWWPVWQRLGHLQLCQPLVPRPRAHYPSCRRQRGDTGPGSHWHSVHVESGDHLSSRHHLLQCGILRGNSHGDELLCATGPQSHAPCCSCWTLATSWWTLLDPWSPRRILWCTRRTLPHRTC